MAEEKPGEQPKEGTAMGIPSRQFENDIPEHVDPNPSGYYDPGLVKKLKDDLMAIAKGGKPPQR